MSLFQVFNLTINSTIIIARFVSIIPVNLLLVLNLFKIRPKCGWLCCGVFSVCLTSMPQLMYYSITIRMYSWALFFVTVCFIYAYDIIHDSNIKNWFITSFSGVCAAYTHYFAAVSVIFIFLLLLIYFIFNNKSEIKKWSIAVVLSSLLYLPWLFILIMQIIAISEGYWIEPITITNLCEYLLFIFTPSISLSPNILINQPFTLIFGFLLINSYLSLLLHFTKSKTKHYENFILLGFFILILTTSFGVIVSILIKPMFIDRYMVPSLAVFWLTFAFLLSKSWDYKKIFVPVLCVILIVSCISSLTFINFENITYNDYTDLNSFLSQYSNRNDSFFIDFGFNNFFPHYYVIEYLLKENYDLNLRNNTNDLSPIIRNYDDLCSNINDNKTVWLISSENQDVILKNCKKNNLTTEKYAQCHFKNSGYSYDIYKVYQ